ncbi:ComEA family DNA-binding protein [Egibacter rhizosphaerae]|uniref:ComEA family DNA-binding protein n=1 Tax=Egibacter rhizosphaerae TaxID=1670831 RepID=A0A411YL32_9ACTN|nr:ComEA family DNA-binding protein [Egibacter rhizosphaerae]
MHVAGAVVEPGVYRLREPARVADALDAAGGPSGDAVLEALNLARAVRDGEQLYVPDEEAVDAAGATPGDGAEAGGGARSGGGAQDERVDLNRADARTLEELPGVGEVTAAAIIEYREEHGPFATVEELAAISGIGEGTVERLRDEAVVR